MTARREPGPTASKLMAQLLRRARDTLLLLVILVACSSKSDSDAADAERYAHLLAFDTARVRLVSARDTTSVIVELAETHDQQTMGLMERRTLPSNAGMLFLYSSVQPESSAFWMYRTRLPLDIAFIDSAGVIRTIQTMVPCTTTVPEGCPNYPAGARYIAAVEVNAGYFSRHGIGVGDKIILSDTATRYHATP